jgi:predicted DNA-binding protein
MIPIPPISVKFTDEERAKLKALAATLGWTESQIVRDSVAHTLHLVHHLPMFSVSTTLGRTDKFTPVMSRSSPSLTVS